MNKRHYEHTLPNIRGSLSNTYDTARYFVIRNLILIVRFFLKVNSYTYIHFKKVLVHGIRVFFLKTRLFLYADDVSVNGVTEFYVFGMKI